MPLNSLFYFVKKMLESEITSWFNNRRDITSDEVIRFMQAADHQLNFYLQEVSSQGEYQVWALVDSKVAWHNVKVVFHNEVLNPYTLYSNKDVLKKLSLLEDIAIQLKSNLRTQLWQRPVITK